MAQNIRYLTGANVGNKYSKRAKSGIPGVDLPRAQRPARTPLSFRSVNLPDTPSYDPGLQRHHLLPRQLLSRRCFGSLFDAIGREWPGLNDFRSNGMLLPSSDAAALRIGLPLHRGPHRDYNAMVIERVGQIEAHWSSVRLRNPAVAHRDAVARLQLLQLALRRRLLDPGRKRLALNRHDPQALDFTLIDAMVDVLWPAINPWFVEPDNLVDQTPVFATAMSRSVADFAPELAWAC